MKYMMCAALSHPQMPYALYYCSLKFHRYICPKCLCTQHFEAEFSCTTMSQKVNSKLTHQYN